MNESPVLRISRLGKAFDRKPVLVNLTLCVLPLAFAMISLQSCKSGYEHLVPPESERKSEVSSETESSVNVRRLPTRIEADIEARKLWTRFLPASFDTARLTVTAYRLADTTSHKLPSFHGYPYLQKLKVKNEKLNEQINQQMNSRDNYAEGFYGCFEPGLGIRLQNGNEYVDALICLKCHELNAFHFQGDAKFPESVEENPLSSQGVNQFALIYNELFPNHQIDPKHLE